MGRAGRAMVLCLGVSHEGIGREEGVDGHGFPWAAIGWLGIYVAWLGEAAVVKGGWGAARLQAVM